MSQFAKQTTVPVSRTREEIINTIERYGATGFMCGQMGEQAVVAFEVNERQVRFILPLPDPTDREFTSTPQRGHKRTDSAATKAYEQAVRQRWRALALVLKAKLEAVETGIVEFDEEFMAHIVMPDGRTVGNTVLPRMRQAIEDGSSNVPLLPDYSTGDS